MKNGPNFIPGFIEACRGTEIPPAFALWTGIAGVSAALGRDVVVERGHYTLYPNLYLVLVAGSGSRKSTSLGLLHDLLLALPDPPHLTSQKETPEALIAELQEARASGGRITWRAEGFGIYDEFVGFLNRRSYDAGMGELLLKLYGCPKRETCRTIARGTEVLENVWFGFIGAATVEGLRESLHDSTIGGGLTSRILFVYSEDRPPPVAFPEDKSRAVEGLIGSFGQLQGLAGSVTWTDEARDAFEREYRESYYNHPFAGDPVLSGYFQRRGDHIIKLAVIFAVDATGDLVIRAEDIQRAIEALGEVERFLPETLRAVGSTAQGIELERVARLVRRAGEISHRELLHRVSWKMTARELREAIETLRSSGQLDLRTGARGGVIYVWKGEAD